MLPVYAGHRIETAFLGYSEVICPICEQPEDVRIFLVSEAESVYGVDFRSSSSRVAFCDFCGARYPGGTEPGTPISPKRKVMRDHSGQAKALIRSARLGGSIKEPAGTGMAIGGLAGALLGTAGGLAWFAIGGVERIGPFLYGFLGALMCGVVGLFVGALWWTRHRYRRRMRAHIKYALVDYKITESAWVEATTASDCPSWVKAIRVG